MENDGEGTARKEAAIEGGWSRVAKCQAEKKLNIVKEDNCIMSPYTQLVMNELSFLGLGLSWALNT